MAWFMGIDIGSGTSKGVITENGDIKAYSILPSGTNYRVTAQKLRDELLTKAALLPEDIAYTVATGRSAGNVPFSNQQVADIRCCAQGINHVFPSVRTVIDIQGQSTQVIRLNAEGKVTDFVTGEKCAAGSGRFLDIIANVLQLEIKDIGPLSLKSKNPITFTTGCAVFGESEAVSRVAEGIAKEDILAGVHQALADRISALVEQVGLEQDCAVSGGGALNVGLARKLEEKLVVKLMVPPQPQLITALGAAIMAEKESSRLEHKPGGRHLQ
jgi:predicted CoA-substrate-specific enzyme activase